MGSNVGYLIGAMFGLIIGLTVSSMEEQWGIFPIPVITMILGGALGRFSAELDRRESVSRMTPVNTTAYVPPREIRTFQIIDEGRVAALLPNTGFPGENWKVGRWLKKPGEFVEVGEIFLIVNWNQIETEIPSPVTGVVESILKPEGSQVSQGIALATIARR